MKTCKLFWKNVFNSIWAFTSWDICISHRIKKKSVPKSSSVNRKCSDDMTAPINIYKSVFIKRWRKMLIFATEGKARINLGHLKNAKTNWKVDFIDWKPAVTKASKRLVSSSVKAGMNTKKMLIRRWGNFKTSDGNYKSNKSIALLHW